MERNLKSSYDGIISTDEGILTNGIQELQQ